MANKVKSLLGGPGFYAVLALCVLAVGVGGYFLLFGEPAQTEAPTGPDHGSLRTGGGPAGARTGGGDRASGGTGGGDGARRHAGGDHPGG
ncbi:MAG: hypothetical protein ACLTYN_15265 [Dysosmobacter welbionis]